MATFDSESGNLTMALTGDALITRQVSMFKEPKFLELVELLRSTDVSITNAEMLFHDYEDPPSAVPGGTHMRAHPKIIEELKWMGLDLYAGANNHSYDFGENGLLRHMRHLDQAGIVYAGLGRTMGEAREPKYLDTPGGRVALISVTSSGPPSLYAGHQWRDGGGRPGANMLRHTCHYTVDKPTFEAIKTLQKQFNLYDRAARGGSGKFATRTWGMTDEPDTDTDLYLGDLQNEWQFPTPDGYRFSLGDDFSVRLVPNKVDLEEITQRIRDARRMADWVVVSFHNHESGKTKDDPSNVAIEFAHAAIDAGADVFHGHGPHRDRGIEIYKGRPIFYSIGHFFMQNDTVERVGVDNIVRQGLDPWESTPADFYESRSGREEDDEWLGNYAPNPAVWRDVIAVVQFEKGEFDRIELRPIDLGFKRPRSQRGRPVMAEPEVGKEVLDLFARLSEPYGTHVEIIDDVGVVRPTG